MNDSKPIIIAKQESKGHSIIIEIVIFIVVYILAGILQAVVLIIFGATETNSNENLIIILMSNIVIIWMCKYYCIKIEHRSKESLGFLRENRWKSYLFGVLVGLLFFISVVILGVGLGVYKIEILSDNSNPKMMLLFFVGYGVQGMAEEVMCKGYLMVSIARKKSVLIAVIVNSAIFGLLHFANSGFSLLAFINLVLFGICTSLLFLKTENLWTVGAFHSIWNFTEGNIFGFSVSGINGTSSIIKTEIVKNKLLGGGEFGPESGLVVTFLEVAFILIMFLIMKKDDIKQTV